MPSKITKRLEALEEKNTGGASGFDHIVLFGGDVTQEQALAAKGLTSDDRVFWIRLVGVEPGWNNDEQEGGQ